MNAEGGFSGRGSRKVMDNAAALLHFVRRTVPSACPLTPDFNDLSDR